MGADPEQASDVDGPGPRPGWVWVTVVCGRCRRTVVREVPASPQPPRYCSEKCRRRQARKRARARAQYLKTALEPGPLCPTPYKRVFATEELARQFIDANHRRDARIAPYLCVCGALHIGH